MITEGRANVFVGIDLGTTNSLVSASDGAGVVLLQDAIGRCKIPSTISLDQDGFLRVGELALPCIASAKKFIGSDVQFSLGSYLFTPQQCAQVILTHLRQLLVQRFGDAKFSAVITVPARFDEYQRQLTRAAAIDAGFTVIRLLNEPTAAALAYKLSSKSKKNYAVYDFGGGTFDVSVIEARERILRVLATNGDLNLGGDNINQAIADRLGIDIAQARALKESGETAEMEALSYPFVEKTIDLFLSAVRDAGLALDQLESVILAGGSCKMPSVRRSLRAVLPTRVKILSHIDPDLVVAIGAGIKAEDLRTRDGTLLVDVVPLSVGIETLGSHYEKLIHRNSPIPVSATEEFTTYIDNQTNIVLRVLQGESMQSSRILADLEIAGIDAMPAGQPRLLVNFTIDSDGILTVDAKELKSQKGLRVELIQKVGEREMRRLIRGQVS